MARPSPCTLLLITRQHLFRADFKPQGKQTALAGLWRAARSGVEEFPVVVEAALALGPKPAGRVWVLSSDFWTHSLAVSAGAVAAVKDTELTQALGFEAESFSGIPAPESALAAVPMGREADQRVYWVTQARSGERDRVEEAVRRAGARLGGLVHPGGLARPLAGECPDEWRRVELWPDAVVLVRGGAGRAGQVSVINADPAGPGRWQDEVKRWLADTAADGAPETLTADGAKPPAAADGVPFDLDDRKCLEMWLSGWAGQLTKAPPAVPLITAPVRPMSAQTRKLITVALLAVVLLLCVGHYVGTAYFEVPLLNEQAAKAEQPAKELAAQQEQLRRMHAQREKAAKEADELRDKVRTSTEVLGGERHRLAQLLHALAESCPPDLVVQQIESDGGEVHVRGACLNPQCAKQLATALDVRLRSLRWHVAAARTEARKQLTDGGPWSFDLQLKELAEAAPTPGAPTTGKAPPRGGAKPTP
jgi:Tfp pilus assembly protein PilN